MAVQAVICASESLPQICFRAISKKVPRVHVAVFPILNERLNFTTYSARTVILIPKEKDELSEPCLSSKKKTNFKHVSGCLEEDKDYVEPCSVK